MVEDEVKGLEASATDKEYETAGSKFITLPPGQDYIDLKVEMGVPDWDTPGSSYKFPVTVIEGVDEGKEEKISSGATAKGIWKTKEIVKAVTGADMPMAKGKDGNMHPVLVPADIAGKTAVGHWEKAKGPKGGVPGAELVTYSKLMAILPEGSKTESLT